MDELTKKLQQFAKEREWGKFHTPRNLAISIVLEATEILEKFQWKLTDELSKDEINELREELADVLIYSLQLCDKLGIDLEEEVKKKIDKNSKKYPIEKVKGKSTKYTKL